MYDRFFKAVFGNKGDKTLTKDLINSVFEHTGLNIKIKEIVTI